METMQLMDRPKKKFESLDLSNLTSHTRYAYLVDNNTLSVVAIELTPNQEVKLLDVLMRSKKVLGWTITDIKGKPSNVSWMGIQDSHSSSDQAKTTFTCPYRTFAFRRMPFELCNSLTTF
ncbi:DNA/RNA polymerases superfamily protein [Gossypium australe]|uniref:DNA/RNA polymerases superfamily protein n=1 Tax=Gossypium australe TaxID=47621 RepID=A0A5B6VNH9_9ROSI|nr:DNA/RNA polymerases superfamily protein [Gossypium australe]